MTMEKRLYWRSAVLAGWLVGIVLPLCSQSPAASSRTETSSQQSLFSPGSDDRLGSLSRISQSQKLIDDKNYEISTAIHVPSINGGERLEREIHEKAQKTGENQFKIERVVRNPDSNGKLSLSELISEEHSSRGGIEEIRRSTFRPDVNGKLVAQSVEQETATTSSRQEKQLMKSVYRLDAEGRLSLAEVEEGSQRRLSEAVTVRETSHQIREASGRMVTVGGVKETTTQLGENSFKKESLIRRADESGRIQVADRIQETQTVAPDGTRKYQRLLESRNVSLRIRNVDNARLLLAQRVTGEERKLPDGSVESTVQIETPDPLNQADGLRLSQTVTETSKPLGNGRVQVERIVKIRDVNGNFVVSQRSLDTLEPGR